VISINSLYAQNTGVSNVKKMAVQIVSLCTSKFFCSLLSCRGKIPQQISQIWKLTLIIIKVNEMSENGSCYLRGNIN
jgi:hypothetical protein